MNGIARPLKSIFGRMNSYQIVAKNSNHIFQAAPYNPANKIFRKHFSSKNSDDFRNQHYQLLQYLMGFLAISGVTSFALIENHSKTKAFVQDGADGNIGHLRSALSVWVNVNTKDDHGNTALHMAVANGKRGAVEFLLTNEALINEKNNNGDTPLILAAARGDSQTIKYLVENQARLNNANNKGQSALTAAVMHHNIPAVKALVEVKKFDKLKIDKVDINFADANGDTPLILAIKEGSLSIIKILLERDDINLNAVNKDGHAALIEAAIKGNLQVLSKLADDKRISLLQTDDNGKNALLIAIEKAQYHVAKFLAAKKEFKEFFASSGALDLLIVALAEERNLSNDQEFKELVDFLNQQLSGKLTDVLSLHTQQKTLEHKEILPENQLMQQEHDVRELEGQASKDKDLD